ncbi:hypothetical protein [Planktothrix pseudagardhii]|uniref:hypothetical protein n=1 Tax=Planktothrix pseudagardhii TaxID=132604 RepID=UPI0020B44C41|nr:hypothetical protein [Planktothrix pseudagardhii]
MDAAKKLEIELESILLQPEFDSYRKVFKEEDSGDQKKFRWAGSALCREQLFLWSLRVIERNRSPFLGTELGQKLRGYLELKISKGKHRSKARASLISKVAEMLFDALLKEIVK